MKKSKWNKWSVLGLFCIFIIYPMQADAQSTPLEVCLAGCESTHDACLATAKEIYVNLIKVCKDNNATVGCYDDASDHHELLKGICDANRITCRANCEDE